jgi:hypothetical protein
VFSFFRALVVFYFLFSKESKLAEKIQIWSGNSFKRPLKKSVNISFCFAHIFSLLDGAEKGMAEFKIGGKIEAKFFKAPQRFMMIKMLLQKPGHAQRTF